jgi:hypothetical protein
MWVMNPRVACTLHIHHYTCMHTLGPAALQKYKYRLVVDESLSLGVLGKQGRGAAEHFGYTPEEVEIIGGSLGVWRMGT